MSNVFESMLFELRENRLNVELAPAPDQRHQGHCVRVVVGRNPVWYRDLCDQHLAPPRRRGRRRSETKVKRKDIEKFLGKLAIGEKPKSYYADALIEISEWWVDEEQDGWEIFKEKEEMRKRVDDLLCGRNYDDIPF